MVVSVEGLVVNAINCGESDKMLTLITRQYGKMSVYCRGGRRISSKFMTASLKFSYGDYVINKTDKLNILQEANAKISFFGLQKDICAAALADYIAEVLTDVSVEEEPDEKTLDLGLNCLYVLSEGKRAPDVVKTVFEWRLIERLGIYPDLSGCCRCGKADKSWYYLDVMNGELTCRDCGGKENGKAKEDDGTARIIILMSGAEVYAANRLINAEKSKMFSLPADRDIKKRLCEASEKYLLNHLERSYKTLEFYKEISAL
ncbi:MAG: DNA repair protein RecO [Clostridia bacterium]|nr:DNA repair protein RecO [Clostridia bacterium]